MARRAASGPNGLKGLARTAVIAGVLSFVAPADAFEPIAPQQLAAARASVETAAIEESTYKMLWCGTVFALEAWNLERDGLLDRAKAADEAANALYFVAASGPLFHLGRDEIGELVGHFATIVLAEVNSPGGVPAYPRDQSLALAP